MVRSYTFKEVSKHDKTNDCWVIIQGKVYDVTKFMDHPGGRGVFKESAGKDASEAFSRRHTHSHRAKEMMKRYCIGDADMTTVPGRSSYRPEMC